MRKNLQGELFSALPAVLQNNIKPVIKLSDFGRYYPNVLNETVDTLWLPSAAELNTESNVAAPGQGKPYPIFNLASSRIKQSCISGQPIGYRTRSSDSGSSHNYKYIDTRGYVSNGSGANSMEAAIGFCL
jgi:hypothetical protein